MLLALLALLPLTASAETPEHFTARTSPDEIYGCDSATWSGQIDLNSDYKQEESFTIIIEDSGGWASPPSLSESGRVELTLPPSGWGYLDLAGERLSAKTTAWIDLAVSSDYGTSVRRFYFGPAVVIETALESREGYSIPSMGNGDFLHESTFSCHSTAPGSTADIRLTVEGAFLESITSNGAAGGWLDSETEAVGLVTCDGTEYTFETRGKLTDPASDGWIGVTVIEAFKDPVHGWYTAGFCGADAEDIPGYNNWPELAEQLADYDLHEGYELVEDEDGELILVPKEFEREEGEESEGSKK